MKGIPHMQEIRCARALKAKELSAFQKQRRLVWMEPSEEEREMIER